MEGIADFLDSLLGGVDLIAYSFAIGSILWGLLVLRPWHQNETTQTVITNSIALLYKGAFALAAIQLTEIVVKVWLMTATLDAWPFPAFLHTIQFQAGTWRIVLALVVAVYAFGPLRAHPHSSKHWLTMGILGIPLIVCGAWLVHGAGRFDDRIQLMSLTVLHQIGAAMWIGGIGQLLSLWLIKRRNEILATLWPEYLRRFSIVGIATVALLLASGIPMALKYITTWNGFIGTGYGNLLLVKMLLLGIALGFAYVNFKSVRAFHHSTAGGGTGGLTHRVPYYIEAETFVLISLLFTAASLSSQPPAVDIPNLTATWQEVAATFQPRMPRVTSPTHEELLAGEAGRVAIIDQVPSFAATAWSDYNHNVSGIFLFVMSIIAMLSYTRRFGAWGRYWPLGFVALGVFLFFRSDAETWPLGPIGFWESTFNNGEVLQHRIATLLVFSLGVMEYNVRMQNKENSKLAYVFPILCGFGGLMLLTHSHVGFEAKTQFLIQVGHTLMGVFSITMACGRWLELRLEPPVKNVAGFLSICSMFFISLILMFYREPLY